MSDEVYDVAIVGAGIIGLMVAYRTSKVGRKVVVIEKEREAGTGVTAGQAGVVHVIQLPFGSLKSRLARKGNAMYDGLCSELGVKLNRMPALLVVRGWSRLPMLFFAYLYIAMGLRGEFKTKLLRGPSLRGIEPELAEGVTAGLVVQGYGTVDTLSLVSKLTTAAESHGAEVKLGWELKSAEVREGGTLLKTNGGDISARWVVNAAGLYSDDVSRILGADLGSHEPGLGVMAVYSGLVMRTIVAPLPVSMGSRTKGGAIIPATDGTTIMGPTLRLASSKGESAYTEDDLELLRAKFGPLLKGEGKLVRVYTGVRPLSPTGDFVIDVDRVRRIVNLIGIESPGLTAAPAVAEMVETAMFGGSA